MGRRGGDGRAREMLNMEEKGEGDKRERGDSYLIQELKKLPSSMSAYPMEGRLEVGDTVTPAVLVATPTSHPLCKS